MNGRDLLSKDSTPKDFGEAASGDLLATTRSKMFCKPHSARRFDQPIERMIVSGIARNDQLTGHAELNLNSMTCRPVSNSERKRVAFTDQIPRCIRTESLLKLLNFIGQPVTETAVAPARTTATDARIDQNDSLGLDLITEFDRCPHARVAAPDDDYVAVNRTDKWRAYTKPSEPRVLQPPTV
jgi:hypothetical protein